jgi:hypothetical protein
VPRPVAIASVFGESSGRSLLISPFETTACTTPDKPNPKINGHKISQEHRERNPKLRGQFLPRFPCRSLNRLRDVRYPDHATDRDDEAIAFRDSRWSLAAISVAACQATESASANTSIFMTTSPMRISRLRRNSARCARLFDRLRSFPTCSAHIHRLGCPPSAPDRRLATPLRHGLRGHKKKACTRVCQQLTS